MTPLIVITGASSGIGRELALNLAARNHKVLAIARDEERLMELKSHAPSLIDVLSADIGREKDREKILSHVPKQAKITHLIHNAALMAPSGLLESISLSEWRTQMGVNVEAPLFLTQDLLPFLHGGRILSLTVYSSFNISVGLGAYGISKAALNMLTKYFQAELKQYEIAVGLALPGLVETNIQKQLPDDPNVPIRERVNQLQAEKKLLSPQVSAAFLTWLLLDTDPEQFSGQTWDIYDAKHHPFWAKHLSIPRLD